MDDQSIAYEWARTHKHDEEDYPFFTILALNILDGVSKYDYDTTNTLMAVYDGINDKTPKVLDKKVHEIIEMSRSKDPLFPKEEFKEIISNLRIALSKDLNKNSYRQFEQYIWNNIS